MEELREIKSGETTYYVKFESGKRGKDLPEPYILSLYAKTVKSWLL